MITVLCGGVGGSRFMRALASVVPSERLTAIINTADDDEFHGLHVSPDADIVTYALAGVVDEERGGGFQNETFRWLESMKRYGHETWFRIGDRDLATHLHRTRMLRNGATLSQVTADIARAFGVRATLLPMSDDRVRTMIDTDGGTLTFQEYLVKRRALDAIRAVRYDGADAAAPAPGVLAAIASAEVIFVAPSNPIGSVYPILAVPSIRDAVRAATVARVAVSPIIDGRSLQPPAAEMMAALGFTVDVAGVAQAYTGLIDKLIVDDADADRADTVWAHRIEPVVAATVMTDDVSRAALVRAALLAAGIST